MGYQYPYLSSVKTLIKTTLNFDGRRDFLIQNCKIISKLKYKELNFRYYQYRTLKLNSRRFGSDQISGVDIRKRMNLKSTLIRFKLIEDNKTKFDSDNIKISKKIISEDKPETYIVKEGDSLYDIAAQYNVNLLEIVDLNNIKDPSKITINQILLIPRNQINNLPITEQILVVSGYGSGHGVGMSQWGARYMATKGAKAEEILKHFYKGVK